MRQKVIAITVLAAAVCSTPVLAQGTYVSASLAADVVRLSHAEPDGGLGFDGGEAFGVALRAGTPLGTTWGVEAEFSRASAIEQEGTTDRIPIALPGVALPGGVSDLSVLPPLRYRLRSSYQDLTMSAAVWARQDLSARMALVYVGGVGFHRVELEQTLAFDGFPIFRGIPVALPSPSITKGIVYSARPFAGMEARIGMGERLELVPGVRVHGLSGGVVVRPSIGLGWRF